jgi:hypothetical protein
MHGKLGGSWHNLRGLVQHKPLAKEIENLSQKSKSIAAQCDYVISPFFSTPGFATFRNREIATGVGAIREQLADLDLRIIIENSVVEWKELEDIFYATLHIRVEGGP